MRKTRFDSRLDRWIERATTPRAAAIVIASVATGTSIIAALLMTVIDSETFASFGSGLWWAVQTVTTVGYGDIVPVTATGRIAASIVMLLGTGFLVVVTAAITSSFVARSRETVSNLQATSATDQLREIRERLDRIDALLDSQ